MKGKETYNRGHLLKPDQIIFLLFFLLLFVLFFFDVVFSGKYQC